MQSRDSSWPEPNGYSNVQKYNGVFKNLTFIHHNISTTTYWEKNPLMLLLNRGIKDSANSVTEACECFYVRKY